MEGLTKCMSQTLPYCGRCLHKKIFLGITSFRSDHLNLESACFTNKNMFIAF